MVTPADQFAEAMQEVVSDIWNGERPLTTVLRTLARAFAGGICEALGHHAPCKSRAVIVARKKYDTRLPGFMDYDGVVCIQTAEEHAVCIAAFFKRCGLE